MRSRKRQLNLFWLFIIVPLGGLLGQDNLSVDPDVDAQTLVQDVFASGTCETISNIEAIGEDSGIGLFSGGANIVGFDRGIILSTGNVTDASGPNLSNDTGTELAGATGDQDLSRIAQETVFDHQGIESDFIPLDSIVTFRYVFASEEYCEFVGNIFNDVFGFFISGPGLNGTFSLNAVNAAKIPNSDDQVSINTVNHINNSAFYIPNELNADQILCGLDQTPNPFLESLEYDGFTVPLTATLKLFPCETYHIRLVVADVGDENYDSAVLLEAGSFDLGGSVSLEANGADPINQLVFEGCGSGGFRVVRGEDSDPNTDQTISYRFGGNSTATEGVDFLNPGGTVTIPAGEMFVDVNLQTIADNQTEGPETVWMVLDIPCACYTDSVMITIVETEPLAVSLPEARFCPDQAVTLVPEITGGAPPFTYQWSTGNTEANPVLMPPLPANIQLQVTDACGQVQSDQVNSLASQPPTAALPPQTIERCWGDSVPISVNLTGQPPILLTYQRDGNTPETLEFSGPGTQSWDINLGGTYRLLEVSDRACNGTVLGEVQANFYRPVINPSLTNPRCADGTGGSISIQHLPTVPPYTYQWTGTDATGTVAENLPVGAYGLRVTDALGCSDEREFELRGPTPLLPIEISCNQVRRPPLALSASGGQAPYLYSIDGVDFWTADAFHLLTPGRFYELTIQDANGCELIQPDFFFPKASIRPVAVPSFIPQELGRSVRVEPDFEVPSTQIESVRWYPPELFNCSTCPNPDLSAPFSQSISLVVTDVFGCVDSLVTWVGVDSRAPLFVPNIFSPNGDGTNDVVAVFANLDQVEQIISFRIFNRWGEQLYEDAGFTPNSARRGWDGRFRGDRAPSGTYVWVAEIGLTNGDRIQETGTVVLMR